MKTLIVGSTLIIKSKIKKETLELLEKVNKNALVLYTKDTEEECFRIATNSTGSEINDFSIVFGDADAEGYAICNVALPEEISNEDKRELVTEVFGKALTNLIHIEELITKNLDALLKDYNTLKESISVVDITTITDIIPTTDSEESNTAEITD